jgi:hypothetical protein
MIIGLALGTDELPRIHDAVVQPMCSLGARLAAHSDPRDHPSRCFVQQVSYTCKRSRALAKTLNSL